MKKSKKRGHNTTIVIGFEKKFLALYFSIFIIQQGKNNKFLMV
jgi:hypothetical protein